ncbi:aminoglycoside phosphotransferase family protein [Leclercia adecarboxylata]|uniref:phosphotransferase family protein n=1 Tax=Leclercia TaxID=83654 RepID=UPI0012E83347|nr:MULTISPECIES: phosphotransferase [Leclercia]MEB5748498.1 aminoglycoside phosphotransferase family protein [Leclercia adecarboxylata]QGW16942.1 phosphotransferase [Leclercia sp. Colony189]URM24960.1 phosphotransferase [Leclercia adecarboxylata]UYM56090.1 aminoglycoside phosphotransferase family protein [Leclercia adecarboxylata]
MPARDLSRMGAANVALTVSHSGQAVIEKSPVGAVEFGFYQNAATSLNEAGIATPALFSADATLRKLCMEYIPYPVEQSDVASDEVLTMLARLHRYPVNTAWHYHPHSWSERALEKALILLALPEKSARQLQQFQQRSDVLFSGHRLISGDSNAGNWGRRENGEVVLFDWERFGKGSPAIDLAPLIKGMGTMRAYTDLAERYCTLTYHHSVNELTREIAIAKAWIVTEVILLLYERQKSAFSLYQTWYQSHLPDWLEDTARRL